MRPEDVNPEWVEKATEAVAGEMPACGECGEYGPPRCVYCKDDAEKYARYVLAAVLPEAMAEAWEQGKRTETRMWVETADLSTPDEEREQGRNPYKARKGTP